MRKLPNNLSKRFICTGMCIALATAMCGCGKGDAASDVTEEVTSEAASEAETSTEIASVEATEAPSEAATEASTEAASVETTEATSEASNATSDTTSSMKSDSSSEAKVETTETSTETISQESDNAVVVAGDDSIEADEDKQLQVIVNNADTWKGVFEQGYYTVTDLDRNGRMEIIAASCQGSGMYTYAKVYEVNENKDGLVDCTPDNSSGDIDGGMDYPDFIIDGNFITFTNGSKYVYIASNSTRVSAGEGVETISAFILENGTFGVNDLASKYVNGDTVEYTKLSDESVITEDEFNNISISTYEQDGYSRFETTFSWTDLSSGDDYANLLNCYNKFMGK
ncbi:MAG: hypothetical protein K6B41_01430 [Butyrivibrio sp.]|nr:hypothetical protein [Butyrivibrio sp.]